MSGDSAERDEIIRLLTAGSRQVDYVLAAWLEGADAHGRADAYSDIDLWLCVSDGREEEAIALVRRTLERAGELALAVEVAHPHRQIRQAFFHLQREAAPLLVDLCVQSHLRQFAFRHGMADEKVRILFDEVEAVRFEALDLDELRARLLARARDLERRLPLQSLWVEKELARGRFLDALGAYHRHILEPLVEVLRLRYAPTKTDFHLKHASHDLPGWALARLEELYLVRDSSELESRLGEANLLMGETLRQVRALAQSSDRWPTAP